MRSAISKQLPVSAAVLEIRLSVMNNDDVIQ